MTFQILLFYALAFTAIVSAILMVTRANPVNSALFLILNFIALAGIYLTLHAQFLAVIQIAVYAGAIMVLVLFVIMLLNLGRIERLRERLTAKHYIGIGLGALLLLIVIPVIAGIAGGESKPMAPNAGEIGTIEHLGKELMTSFLFPFEITSVLLLAAIIGAIVLAKKRFPQ